MEALQINPAASTRRRALRLVSTKDMEREDWLEIRKQRIGSSDAAAAIGLNPYKSQLELWMEKTGRDNETPKPNPDDDATPVFWGNTLEPIVAVQYSKRTGNRAGSMLFYNTLILSCLGCWPISTVR